MADSFSDYLEDAALDHAFLGSAYTPASVFYLALSTADPTDDGSGIAEPSGNGYARKSIGGFSTASSRSIANSAQIQFAAASGAWGSLTHWAIYDALTSGNMLAHGTLTNPLNVVSGNAPLYQIGELTISVASVIWSTYLANEMLDHCFGNGVFTQPAAVYMAFSTADPGLDGSGIAEPSGNGYARTQLACFSAASGGSKSNSAQIQFAQASGASGTIAYGALFDAVTSGNFLAKGPVGNPYAVVSGNSPLIDTSQFTLTKD